MKFSSIQAVVLATPHSKHRAQVEAAAAAGKHIYCEKPFALSKADAQAALDAVRRAGVTIAVGHHFRLMPSMRVLAELRRPAPWDYHACGRQLQPRLAGGLSGDSWRLARKSRGRHDRNGVHVLDCFAILLARWRISALSTRALKLATGGTTSA
jgi:predicted dehydrogenase